MNKKGQMEIAAIIGIVLVVASSMITASIYKEKLNDLETKHQEEVNRMAHINSNYQEILDDRNSEISLLESEIERLKGEVEKYKKWWLEDKDKEPKEIIVEMPEFKFNIVFTNIITFGFFFFFTLSLFRPKINIEIIFGRKINNWIKKNQEIYEGIKICTIVAFWFYIIVVKIGWTIFQMLN